MIIVHLSRISAPYGLLMQVVSIIKVHYAIKNCTMRDNNNDATNHTSIMTINLQKCNYLNDD